MPRPRLTVPLVLALLPAVAPAADPKTDRLGDPLPAGAIARLGTGRMAIGFFPNYLSVVPPDFTTYILTDDRGSVGVYDLATGRLRSGGITPRSLQSSAVSADGKVVATSGPLGLIVRDLATGETVREFRSHLWGHLSLSADGSVLARGGQGAGSQAEVVIWDVDRDEEIGRVTRDEIDNAIPVLSPDGRFLAVHTSDHPGGRPGGEQGPGRPVGQKKEGSPLTVHEAAGGKELFTVRTTGSGPDVAAAFSPDGTLLATGSGDGAVDLWEVPSGKPVRTLFGRTGQGVHLAFSPDGKTLAAGAKSGTVQRWEVPGGKLLDTTPPPAGVPVEAFGLGVAAGGRAVAWGRGGSGPAVVWEAPSGKVLSPLGEHLAGVTSIAFGPRGEVVTSGHDGRVVRWDPGTGWPIRDRRWSPPGVPDGPVFALAPGGDRGVSLSRQAAVYDLATGAELFALPRGPARTASYQVVSPDLSRAAVFAVPPVGHVDKDPPPARCTVWDLPAGRRLAALDLPATDWGGGTAAWFSPDGGRLLTLARPHPVGAGQRPPALVGWDVPSAKRLGSFDLGKVQGPISVAVVDETFAAVAATGRVWVVDYETGVTTGTIGNPDDGGAEQFGPVAFGPDRTRFAVGVSGVGPAWASEVRVYDWPRGKLLRTFAGHSGSVTALAFSPDGKSLASGATDTTVLLWDVSDLPAKK